MFFCVLCFTVNYETNNPFDIYQQSFHGGIDPLQELSYTQDNITHDFLRLCPYQKAQSLHIISLHLRKIEVNFANTNLLRNLSHSRICVGGFISESL